MLKKLESKQKALVEEFESKKEIILNDPKEGYYLKQNLSGYLAYDWTFRGIALRICYQFSESDKHVYLVYFGTRENFYAEVANYVSAVKHRFTN